MNLSRKQLPIPKHCDNCESPYIILTTNSVIYRENRGEWPYCYYCTSCYAMVGCHPNTNKPMGLMAVGATRRQRARLHLLFDVIWQNGYLSRDDAYDWLGKELNVIGDCHISQLSKDQLTQAIVLLSAHSKNDYILFKRRKEKSDAKRFARNRRQDSKIARRKGY